jgi:phenylalanyl-tRNA synthetase beta chain
MLISVRWLGRHISLDGLTPQQIASELTIHTAEVESVEAFLPHAREIVVGHVVARAAHPGADRLSLCRVDIGQGEPLKVVCGAANVAEGQRVALALPGTNVPGIGTLKKSKIRGEESFGMICSEREIGISDAGEGIWVLPESLPIGATLESALGLGDHVIDIDNKSLTHRPDLWGHRGIARELSAIYRRPLLPFEPVLPDVGSGPAPRVRVDSDACSRYFALPIDGARALPSPLWLRALLGAVGQRSLGQLVDLSNFVMLDLGQPNHVFDRDRLAPDGVWVGMARRGQKFAALDGRTLELCEEDLLIGSGADAVALAGVIGGAHCEVTEATRALLLEVATFDPTVVRRASVRHGTRTDSSARFEKSLDPELPPRAAAHFARLLCELQPEVTFPAPPTDVRRAAPRRVSIFLRPERVREALGADLSDELMADLLTRLGFDVQAASSGFDVGVPSDRSTKDITIERDLVEEIGRLYGYGNIIERPLICPLVPPPLDERRLLVRRIQDRLAGAACFTETLSYSFHSDELLELLGLAQFPHATLENPVVAQQSRLRRSVAPSLLAGIEANRRQRDVVRLFEIGKGYLPEQLNAQHEPREQHLAAVLWAAPPPAAGAGFRDNSLAKLQATVSDVLAVLERPSVEWGAGDAPPWAIPGRGLVARYPNGDVVATLAPVRTEVLFGLGLKGRGQSDVALGELSLDAVLAQPRQTKRYVPVPRYPGIKVDVAVAVARSALAGDISAVIRAAAGGTCAGVELFDVYTGDSVGAGRKSLAYHVLLQAEDRTLGDTEERKFLTRLEAGLEAIGAELRDG